MNESNTQRFIHSKFIHSKFKIHSFKIHCHLSIIALQHCSINMKEKVMIVAGWVFPGTGGTIAILNNLVEYFSPEEAILVGRPHLLNDEQEWPSHLPKLHHFTPLLPPKGRMNKWRRLLGMKRLERQLKQIAKVEKCTRILSIFPDEFAMRAAYNVSKELDLPFYTWFHNTYLDNREGYWLKLAKRWQPAAFDHARVNFVMSEGMRDFYREVYPDLKFEPLEHGFVIPEVTYNPPAHSPQGKTKFMFSGSLNASCMDASMRLFKHIIANPNYELHLFTRDIRYLDEYGISGENVVRHGFHPLSEFVKRLHEFDIMLLPHGFEGGQTEAEYRTIFPTRTVPLLYSNRPILAHSPPHAFLSDFLKKRDCAEVVETKDTQAIQTAIDTLIENEERRNQLIKNALETSSFFDVNRIGKKLKETLFKK